MVDDLVEGESNCLAIFAAIFGLSPSVIYSGVIDYRKRDKKREKKGN